MKKLIQIPKQIKQILDKIQEAGFAAYVVGGAVRDLISGREPKDFDIVTNAHPLEIVALAGKAGWKAIDQLGHNFGVIIVVVDSMSVEIATYRSKRYGKDHERADVTWYAQTLEEDLARRDFTVNAMALNECGTIIDPFDGQVDLARRIVRAVRNAEERFAEDGLRMFRVCRLAAQLGFSIEDGTANAVSSNLNLTEGLPLERVRRELEGMLTADWPEKGLDALVLLGLAGTSCRVKAAGVYTSVEVLPELKHLVDLPQDTECHRYDAWHHTLKVVAAAPNDVLIRWAALLHDVGKGLPFLRGIKKNGQPSDYGHERVSADMAAGILERFQYPSSFSKRVKWLVSRHMHFVFASSNSLPALHSWVRREARSGVFRSTQELVEGFRRLGELGLADIRGSGKSEADIGMIAELVEALCEVASTMPVHTSELKYETAELMPLLGDRQYIGPFLRVALQRVQDRQLANTPEDIRKAAESWIIRRK